MHSRSDRRSEQGHFSYRLSGDWDSYSSLLKKNSPDSSSLMFYLLRVDALPYLTDVSGRMAQMTQFIS
jgi:hypothetical protein